MYAYVERWSVEKIYDTKEEVLAAIQKRFDDGFRSPLVVINLDEVYKPVYPVVNKTKLEQEEIKEAFDFQSLSISPIGLH